MNFAPLIAKKSERFRELEAAIAAPDFYSNPQRAKELMREHTRLKSLLAMWDAYQKAQTELRENQELSKDGDAEMAQQSLGRLGTAPSSVATLVPAGAETSPLASPEVRSSLANTSLMAVPGAPTQ